MIYGLFHIHRKLRLKLASRLCTISCYNWQTHVTERRRWLYIIIERYVEKTSLALGSALSLSIALGGMKLSLRESSLTAATLDHIVSVITSIIFGLAICIIFL